MFTVPVPTEIVYQVSNKDERQILQEHFNVLYHALTENRLVPNAAFETVKGIRRCLSGIPVPYHNVVFGYPESGNWDECIEDQLSYFSKAKVPFVWYLDEGASPEFKQKRELQN